MAAFIPNNFVPFLDCIKKNNSQNYTNQQNKLKYIIQSAFRRHRMMVKGKISFLLNRSGTDFGNKMHIPILIELTFCSRISNFLHQKINCAANIFFDTAVITIRKKSILIGTPRFKVLNNS